MSWFTSLNPKKQDPKTLNLLGELQVLIRLNWQNINENISRLLMSLF